MLIFTRTEIGFSFWQCHPILLLITPSSAQAATRLSPFVPAPTLAPATPAMASAHKVSLPSINEMFPGPPSLFRSKPCLMTLS